MYPSTELKQLAQRKARLRQSIAAKRLECLADAAVLAKPIALVDRAVVLWRKFAPVAKAAIIPLALMLKQRLASRKRDREEAESGGAFARALKWMPVVLSAARMYSAARER